MVATTSRGSRPQQPLRIREKVTHATLSPKARDGPDSHTQARRHTLRATSTRSTHTRGTSQSLKTKNRRACFRNRQARIRPRAAKTIAQNFQFAIYSTERSSPSSSATPGPLPLIQLVRLFRRPHPTPRLTFPTAHLPSHSHSRRCLFEIAHTPERQHSVTSPHTTTHTLLLSRSNSLRTLLDPGTRASFAILSLRIQSRDSAVSRFIIFFSLSVSFFFLVFFLLSLSLSVSRNSNLCHDERIF